MTASVYHQTVDVAQLAGMFRTIIDQFPGAMQNTALQNADPAVGEMMQTQLHKWGIQVEGGNKAHTIRVVNGHNLAINVYEHVRSPQIQAEIALYTYLVQIVDDRLIEPQATEEFAFRLCSGSRQLHPALEHLAQICHDLHKSYPAFGASSIYPSTIDFVTSEHFQGQNATKDLSLCKDSIPYAKFMRDKDAIGAAYAAFIWPKDVVPNSAEYIQVFPDTADLVGYFNDIFSYYKEAKAGETGTYISKLATANERPEIEELGDLIAHVLTLIHRVRRILGAGEVRDFWESAMRGFVRFHLQAPRYQLSEVFPELSA